MKTFLTIFISCFVFCSSLNAQSVSGNLTLLANQEIELECFSGLKTYPISSTKVDEAGGFFKDGDFYFHHDIKDDFNFDGNTFHPDNYKKLDMLEKIKENFIINFPKLESLLNNNKFSVKIIEKKYNAYFSAE